jgi:TonB family protein
MQERRRKCPRIRNWVFLLSVWGAFTMQATEALAQVSSAASPVSQPPSAAPAPASSRRKLNAAEAAGLRVQTVPPKYPQDAAKAGIQGAVALTFAVDTTGAVKDVTVESGDPALASAAVEAVRQWKYKPYMVEGAPTEFQTDVTLNFRFNTAPPMQPAPSGSFKEDEYVNEHFALYYPLSRDWVRETEALRKRVAASGIQGTTPLLGAVRIPEKGRLLRADSSLTLMASNRSPGTATQDCKAYLDGVASSLAANKDGKQKGDFSEFSVAGHSFLRGDFEQHRGLSDRSVVCEAVKDYLLLWSFGAWSKEGVEAGVETLRGLQTAAPAPDPVPASSVNVSQGVSRGLLIHKVNPEYPAQARQERIQGTVVLNASISKTGDIVNLEVLDGPIELVPSAVNAVRDWKYRPYLLKGEPVEVDTQISVNYELRY